MSEEIMSDIKLFNKWSYDGIKVVDEGLRRYVSLKPVIVPKTGSRVVGVQFHKSNLNIIERLVNKLMVVGHRAKKHKYTSGQNTGKSQNSMRLVEQAFTIIEQKTKQNPIQVFITALENAATREEIIAIEYGGARYPKAVECSPQRRIDIVLRIMTQSTYQKSVGSKKRAAESLADEIMHAYANSNQSAAVAKKIEMERQADSSR